MVKKRSSGLGLKATIIIIQKVLRVPSELDINAMKLTISYQLVSGLALSCGLRTKKAGNPTYVVVCAIITL
jgi:hypothetical protein